MKLKDLFKDALPIIEQVAPTVGAAIGGPFGAAAGAVIPILANAFDGHPGDIKTLVNNILQDPDAANKLQLIENQHGDWLDSLMTSVNNLARAEINIKLEWQETK